MTHNIESRRHAGIIMQSNPFFDQWEKLLGEFTPSGADYNIFQPYGNEHFVCVTHEDKSKHRYDEQRSRNLLLVQNMEHHWTRPWKITETTLYRHLIHSDTVIPNNESRTSYGILAAGNFFALFEFSGRDREPLCMIGTGERPVNKQKLVPEASLKAALEVILKKLPISEFKLTDPEAHEPAGGLYGQAANIPGPNVFVPSPMQSVFEHRNDNGVLPTNTLQLDGVNDTPPSSGMRVSNESRPSSSDLYPRRMPTHSPSDTIRSEHSSGARPSSSVSNRHASGGEIPLSTNGMVNTHILYTGVVSISSPSVPVGSVCGAPRASSRTSNRHEVERPLSSASSTQNISAIQSPRLETPIPRKVIPSLDSVQESVSDSK